MMVRSLLTIGILLSTFAAFAAEIPVSDFTYGNPPMRRALPAVAAGGDGYLAAWRDERTGGGTLLVTRLTAAGEPLDSTGIPLGPTAFGRPQVIWNGEAWLVFWVDTDSHTLLMARVSAEGIVTPPQEVLFTLPDLRGRSIATNGTYIVIAHFAAPLSGHDARLQLAVLTRDGTLVDDRIVETRLSLAPTVIVAGDQFVAAWTAKRSEGGYELMAERLDARGAAIDTSPRIVGSAEDEMELVRHGSGYVAFGPQTADDPPQYTSWAVSSDLTSTTPPAPLAFRPYERIPALLDGDDGAVVLTFESNENAFVTAIRFDEQGHESERRHIVESSAATWLAAGYRSGSLALVRVDDDWPDLILKGSIYDRATLGETSAARPLTGSALPQWSPALAAAQNNILAVWAEPGSLHAARFLPNGVRLDDPEVLLGSSLSEASILFDGQRYVIGTVIDGLDYDTTDILIRFLTTAGTLLPDTIRIPRHWSSTPVTLARGDGVTLVTWSDGESIYAAGIQGTQLTIPPRVIATQTGYTIASTPGASWNGRHFLLAWNVGELDYDVFFQTSIVGMRVGPDLAPADAQPRQLGEGSRSFTGWATELASVGEDWLLVWSEGYAPSEIRVVRISADGLPAGSLQGTVIANGSSPQIITAPPHPYLAWTTDDDVLRAAAVRADGTLDPDGQRSIVPPPIGYSFGGNTALATGAGGLLLAYARVSEPAGHVTRVFIDIPELPRRRRAVR